VQFGEFTTSSVLAMAGILLSGILIAKKVKGALFYSILACAVVGIPLGVTSIPDGFMPVSAPQSLAPTFCMFDFSQIFTLEIGIVIFTLLFMNIFDTVGSLVGLASKTGVMDAKGNIPRVKGAMISDAIGTTFGAMLGTSTITPYIESASGVAEGGRSGVTAMVTGILFLCALFFAPVFLLIPSAATSGALVLVGVFMLESVVKIDMEDISEALPAFITIIMMILTYSIADGMILGLLCYVLIKLLCGKHREVTLTMYILAALFILNYILI
jgi:AGZA family xanthine/uracil permease-like MFS transporter